MSGQNFLHVLRRNPCASKCVSNSPDFVYRASDTQLKNILTCYKSHYSLGFLLWRTVFVISFQRFTTLLQRQTLWGRRQTSNVMVSLVISQSCCVYNWIKHKSDENTNSWALKTNCPLVLSFMANSYWKTRRT